MGQIKIGVQIQPHHMQYEAMRSAWLQVEALGVDTLFNWDHLTPRFGNPTGSSYECWTTLGAMAEVTSRVQIGPLVSVDSYRLPAIHAYQARTINAISGGRLIFGLGAGGWDEDTDEAGLPRTTDAARLHQLEEHLPVLLSKLRDTQVPSASGPIPILIGGGGEQLTLRIVARFADIWNGQGDPATILRKNQVLDDWCASVGRDPRDIERSVLLIRPEHVEQADDYLTAGITHLIYSVRAPANDLSPVEQLLQWRDEKQR